MRIGGMQHCRTKHISGATECFQVIKRALRRFPDAWPKTGLRVNSSLYFVLGRYWQISAGMRFTFALDSAC